MKEKEQIKKILFEEARNVGYELNMFEAMICSEELILMEHQNLPLK